MQRQRAVHRPGCAASRQNLVSVYMVACTDKREVCYINQIVWAQTCSHLWQALPCLDALFPGFSSRTRCAFRARCEVLHWARGTVRPCTAMSSAQTRTPLLTTDLCAACLKQTLTQWAQAHADGCGARRSSCAVYPPGADPVGRGQSLYRNSAGPSPAAPGCPLGAGITPQAHACLRSGCRLWGPPARRATASAWHSFCPMQIKHK